VNDELSARKLFGLYSFDVPAIQSYSWASSIRSGIVVHSRVLIWLFLSKCMVMHDSTPAMDPAVQ
jgi:hypothetical protein